MKTKTNNTRILNGRNSNIIVGLVGIISILVAIITGIDKTISIILLSVGTSILSSAVVTGLNAKYLIQQNEMAQMAEHWGIVGIYKARAEINVETNSLLKNVKNLDICAMGLKGFRDAQGKLVEKRISEGMRLRILTLSPNSPILSTIDETEGLASDATRATIVSLVEWINILKQYQLTEGQVEIKTYNHYPYDFYFCMDGEVFTGPYQTKTSQQTITYKFLANSVGANSFAEFFESLWEEF